MTEQPGDPPRAEPGLGRTGDVSRLGTARAVVLLAAVLAAGGAVLVCFAVFLFGPVVFGQSGRTGTVVLAAVVFALVVVLFAVAGGVLAARGRTVGSVVASGCGTLLAGILIALAALALLISASA